MKRYLPHWCETCQCMTDWLYDNFACEWIRCCYCRKAGTGKQLPDGTRRHGTTTKHTYIKSGVKLG